MAEKADVLIVGAGFFGAYLAEYLADKGLDVVLCERGGDIMERASYANQARIHNGYHYPRSILTAFRSRESFPRFCEEFPACVDDNFEKYYLIGKTLSHISPIQFETFCKRINAEFAPAPSFMSAYASSSYVAAAYQVKEYAFNSIILRDVMRERLAASDVQLLLGRSVASVHKDGDRIAARVVNEQTGEETTYLARQVFNCTYSELNALLASSGLPLLPLKHEVAEVCIVEPPSAFQKMGVTVMCGPFFSIMPFPPLGKHSFTHVRYTPHTYWNEAPDAGEGAQLSRAGEVLSVYRNENPSAFKKMRMDARRYLPALEETMHDRSLWEVKTVLPSSEVSDSRPILFKPDYGLQGFHCVMGGKIDNVFDMVSLIEEMSLI